MRKILSLLAILCALQGLAQKSQEELQQEMKALLGKNWDKGFKTGYRVDIGPQNSNTIIDRFHQNRKEKMNYKYGPYEITSRGVKISYDNYTVRQSKSNGTAQKNYKKQQSDARRREFFERRQEERRQAAIDAHNRKVERERQERMKDEIRAAEARAYTARRLQGRTDMNIQNDYWHANEGKKIVQQTAREAIGMPQGMTVIHTVPQKSSGSTMANNMRINQNRSRSRRPVQRTTAHNYNKRAMPPVLRQRPNKSGEYVFTGRATKTQIFIKKDPKVQLAKSIDGPATSKGGPAFRLSPHATVTTGQPWPPIEPKQPERELKPVFPSQNKKRPQQPIVKFDKELTYNDMLDELLPDVHSNY